MNAVEDYLSLHIVEVAVKSAEDYLAYVVEVAVDAAEDVQLEDHGALLFPVKAKRKISKREREGERERERDKEKKDEERYI